MYLLKIKTIFIEQVRFIVLLQSGILLHVFTASDIIDTDLYCQEEGFYESLLIL